MSKKKIFSQIILGLLLITLASITVTAQIDLKPPVPKGLELIDGDILMPKGFLDSLEAGRLEATAYRTNLWTGGTVFYEYDANVTAANQTNMNNAMIVLTSVSAISFIQCVSGCVSGNYAHIQSSTANNSQVGMVGGQQIINITSWTSQFIIAHELLHCAGFFHEHVRPDRANFVTVNCNAPPAACNIQGGFGGTLYNNNFVIPGDASAYGPYDFDSVMHYDVCSFSIDCPAGATCNCTNTVLTIIGTVPPGVTVGQRTHLSSLDSATLSYLYPYSNWRFVDCGYGGGSGASDGSFIRPFTTIAGAIASAPPGGTIWILRNCTFPTGTYSSNVTIKAAAGVTATFGS